MTQVNPKDHRWFLALPREYRRHAMRAGAIMGLSGPDAARMLLMEQFRQLGVVGPKMVAQ